MMVDVWKHKASGLILLFEEGRSPTEEGSFWVGTRITTDDWINLCSIQLTEDEE